MIADSGPSFLFSVFAFLVAISILVFVHEMGHYLVGRWCGVKANVFSIGFGKELFGWSDKRGTRWKVSLLPLGGYVQFAGDMDPSGAKTSEWLALPEKERNQTFQAKSLAQRAAIVFAGPAINFLLAIAIISGFVTAYGEQMTKPVVASLVAGGAAEKMGLKEGDTILSVNDAAVNKFDELAQEVSIRPGYPLTLKVLRGKQELALKGANGTRYEQDRFGNRYAFGQIGVGSPKIERRDVPFYEVPIVAVKMTASVTQAMVTGLGQIISGRRPVDELGGPMKIAQYSGEQMEQGGLNFLNFIALMSINLGFMNLLPIPMLDGGHLMLYGIEAVRRKPASARTQELLFRAGFALLISFMLFTTFNDLSSFGLFG